MTEPYVSVVIPVFDRPEVLDRVLHFFELQSYPRFEVIVVDDGSRERIADRLAQRRFGYPLRVAVQPNRGRASARNRGIALAEGELVLFCDADRLPHPDWIRLHVRAHERAENVAAVGIPWDCFYGNRLARAGAGEVADLLRYSRLPEYYQVTTPVFEHGVAVSRVAWATFLVGNASVKRSELVRVGGFDERLTQWGVEHFELARRLVDSCGIAIHRCEAASFHVPHARSASQYRAGLDAAVAALAGTPSGPAIAAVREFLVGEISLQTLEQRCHETTVLAALPPIWYRQLR